MELCTCRKGDDLFCACALKEQLKSAFTFVSLFAQKDEVHRNQNQYWELIIECLQCGTHAQPPEDVLTNDQVGNTGRAHA